MVQTKPLGEILCEKYYITQYQLEHALEKQIEEYQLLGELLVSLDHITEKQLEESWPAPVSCTSCYESISHIFSFS